jgi:5-methylcytosine-specific restriction protein B
MPPKPELLSPQRMIWDLWWRYSDLQWNEEEAQLKEAKLFNLLGIEIEPYTPYELIWKKMEHERNESQISYLDNLPFKGINLKNLLNTINKRIEKLLGKDNLIGHAYFMDVHGEVDLKSVFQDKIIPLLQEYFFGDYSKIGLVLGKGFIELKEIKPSRDLFADFHHDSKDELLERPTWKIADVKDMSPHEFSEAIDLLMRKPKTTLSEDVN